MLSPDIKVAVCVTASRKPLKKELVCVLTYFCHFSLILPARQNAAALAGGQEGFLDQGHQTKDSGPMRALGLNPWQLWSSHTGLYYRPPSEERKTKQLSWIRFNATNIFGFLSHASEANPTWCTAFSYSILEVVFIIPSSFQHISSFPFSWLVARP